jgi:hypothetical protein
MINVMSSAIIVPFMLSPPEMIITAEILFTEGGASPSWTGDCDAKRVRCREWCVKIGYAVLC